MHDGLTVGRARPDEFEEAEAFYRSVERDPERVRACDTIVLARLERRVVGAVALCTTEGHLVLRTMVVREEMRGEGIGRALLDATVREIGPRPCWLLGFGDLIEFYGRVGFGVIDEGRAPAPLQRRLAAYREHADPERTASRGGFVMMHRPGSEGA